MSLFVSQPPSHGVRNNDRSHSAPRFQSLGTQSKKMKRGRENSMPNPFLASKANTAARPSLPTCPREFLSSIPHPLPSGIGTQYLRSMRDIAAITGEAPPFMMRMLNARSSLPPFLSSPDAQAKRMCMKYGPAPQAEGTGNNTPKNGTPPIQRETNGDVQREVPIISTSGLPADTSVKRIWPVMGFGKLEIHERQSSYCFELDIPGVMKDRIDVSLKPSSIVVECTRDPVPYAPDRYHHNERPAGKLIRTIQLPSKADPDAISCSYVNGVLLIEVGKKEVTEEVVKVVVK